MTPLVTCPDFALFHKSIFGGQIERDANSPTKIFKRYNGPPDSYVQKRKKNRRSLTKYNGVLTEEVTFTKEQNDFDEELDGREGRSIMAQDTVVQGTNDTPIEGLTIRIHFLTPPRALQRHM